MTIEEKIAYLQRRFKMMVRLEGDRAVWIGQILYKWEDLKHLF